MAGFLSVCYWVFFVKSKKDFDDAANLPFADEENSDSGQAESPVDTSSSDHQGVMK